MPQIPLTQMLIFIQYIGEEGASCMLKAAVVCSNPWNLDTSSIALQRTWLGREIYSKTMGTNMKRLLERHYEQVSKNPKLDFEKIRKVKYLHEFDREVQGPTWGYPTEGTSSLYHICIFFTKVKYVRCLLSGCVVGRCLTSCPHSFVRHKRRG
jgi:hypothetical protein